MSSSSEWDGGSEEDSSMEDDLEGESCSTGKCVLCGENGNELVEIKVEQDFRDLFSGVGGENNSEGGSDKLQVCGSCHLTMKSALEKRKKAAKIESRVRSLQLEILKELRVLQREMGWFYEEMVKLEGLVSGCSAEVKGSPGITLKWKIIEAVNDLGTYRDGIAVKLECSASTTGIDDAKMDQGSSLDFSPVLCKEEPEDEHQDDDNFDNMGLSPMESSSPIQEPRSFLKSYQNLFGRVQRNSKVYKESEKLTESMSPFKRRIVLYIIRTSEIHKAMLKEGLKSPARKVEGPEFEYNLKTGKITLENVEITLNEHLKSLHCSLCPVHKIAPEKFPHSGRWKGLAEMRMHILSAHLKKFQCSVCGQSMASNKTLELHMTIRHPSHATEKTSTRVYHICDICGRPFLTKKRLDPHKWRHLNAQEKEVAISKGLGPPPPARVPGSGHQCSKCGKSFRWKSSLKIHENNQSCSKPPGKRRPPKEKAGPEDKKVKARRKYFCRRGCGRELHDMSGMLRHEKRCDGQGTTAQRKNKDGSSSSPVVGENKGRFVREEYPCYICGRGIASKISLRGHLLTHMSDEERNEAERKGGVKLPPNYGGKMERKTKPPKKSH